MAPPPPRVVVTRRLRPSHIARLRAGLPPDAELVVHDDDSPMPRDALLAAVSGGAGAVALVCTLSEAVDAALVSAAGGRLAVVSTMSVGYSHVDTRALKAGGGRLGNTPGVLTDATADLVLALTLATARRVVEAAGAVKSGEWAAWKPFWMTGKELARATVGIIGMGRIGQAVARRLRGFECAVVYDGRGGAKPDVDAALGTRHVPREELLRTADFVIVLCALTPETRGLIGAAELAAMKPDAVLINAARGEVLDQDALVAALEARPALRAGLDVTTPEPLPVDHALLTKFGGRVCVLPHIGSAGEACRDAMADMTVDNALAALSGGPMPAEVML